MTSQDDNRPKVFPRTRDYAGNDNYFLHPEGERLVDTEFSDELGEQKRDEEFAAETAVNPNELRHEKETHMEEDVQVGWGWAAIVLAFLSFFMWPFLMGIAGIVVGVMAKRRGADTLGNIAITAAIAALVIRLVIAPFIY
ncbi:DUF4190 domain-containing protein [Salirhabdus salicampi]|uniref:DUF4190 domain-containing protein n=1 Tax=Salirhabdus salicampi TaxID=476102 RepID=UPI0020C3FA43|nr:DUF4190 domain-containing protein [Salirhabdus salicampi]MCP8616881.1 hypothetical protein [Salirhabdus salicampi]